MDQQHVVLNREVRLTLGLLALAAAGDCLGNAGWEGKGMEPEHYLLSSLCQSRWALFSLASKPCRWHMRRQEDGSTYKKLAVNA